MRSVLLWKDMDQVAEQMDAAVFQYVGELQTESFEAFADFDLLAFDWYDVRKAGKSGKVLVYIDREDLFFFCRNEAAQQYVQGAVDTTDAARGCMYSSASSPKEAPGPYVTTLLPSWSGGAASASAVRSMRWQPLSCSMSRNSGAE